MIDRLLGCVLACALTASATVTAGVHLQERGWCPAAIESGLPAVSVTQTCSHPAGFEFETGTGSASAATGLVQSSIVFANSLTFPSGSAAAMFSEPMRIASSETGPLFLTFRVHYAGSVDNHAESSANATSQWWIDSAPLGQFGAPGDQSTGLIDQFEDYTAPNPFAAGDIFLLEGSVFTSAQDYHGRSQLAAELAGIQVRNASGDLVQADVTFIPEPATAGIAALGLLVLGVRRRLSA